MGLLTWIVIGLVILAIIGLGAGTFFSGVWSGVKKVEGNPIVQDAAQQGKKMVENGAKQIINDVTAK